MFAEERQQHILTLLQSQHKVSVIELSEQYKVSKTTIRADLKALEAQHLIIKTHGGAMVKSHASFELGSEYRKSIHHDKKVYIGQLAAQFIEKNDTVLLDTGTTTLQIAHALKNKTDITVITNDMEIAKTLEDFSGIQIILLGGMIKKGYHCSFQLNSHSLIGFLHIDKAFMACNSFSIEKGAAVADIHLCETKRMMIKHANQIFLVCDDSKFNQSALAQFATTQEIDYLIINQKPKHEQLLLEQNIKVIY